jgi:hypothetical protein
MAEGAAGASPVFASDADGQAASPYEHFYEIIVAFRDARPDANGTLSIAHFLEAMTKFLRIVDALGTPALADLVKKDVKLNITVRFARPPSNRELRSKVYSRSLTESACAQP